ncbi:hypothetical protein EIP91_006243 [Steccherinum ochraceum]|uniref:Uncharacterized protein n=1 Tax=Steccherinum ochraceum TaxID=92696 RepID=A0A4R0R8J4_9APHY|nr:hypothetical protein EIP91_006243 [Steccherinum ochraceum]
MCLSSKFTIIPGPKIRRDRITPVRLPLSPHLWNTLEGHTLDADKYLLCSVTFPVISLTLSPGVLQARTFPHLTSFHCDLPLDAQLWVMMAGFAHLEAVKIAVPSLKNQAATASSTSILMSSLAAQGSQPFRTLHTANFLVSSAAAMSTFLKVAKLPALKVLVVCFTEGETPSEVDVSTLCNTIADQMNHTTLTRIQLLSLAASKVSEWDEEKAVKSDVLKPLAAFSTMLQFDVSLPWFIKFDDALLRTLAAAWPKLQHINFGLSVPWSSPVQVTLRGLEILAVNCPSLQHIATRIHWDDEHNDGIDDATLPAAGRSAPLVSKLSFGNSIITSWECVALFLSSLFPNVEVIEAWKKKEGTVKDGSDSDSDAGLDDEEQDSKYMWADIVKTVPLLAAVRAQEQRILMSGPGNVEGAVSLAKPDTTNPH